MSGCCTEIIMKVRNVLKKNLVKQLHCYGKSLPIGAAIVKCLKLRLTCTNSATACKMGPKKMSGRNISYVKPSEPAFLKRLKEQVGFKEGPTIETKREQLRGDEGNDETERDDELPVVVVLKPGDLSQEEADAIINKLQDDTDPEPSFRDEKITFKKPEKRNASEDLTVASTKKHKTDEKKPRKAASDVKQIRNKGLLSFDDEDDDDA